VEQQMFWKELTSRLKLEKQLQYVDERAGKLHICIDDDFDYFVDMN